LRFSPSRVKKYFLSHILALRGKTFYIEVIYLTPFIPLSFKGEGEEILERGFAPLLPTLPLT